MVIRQRAIQAEDKQERHQAILDAAARLLAALARAHRERGRGRRRGRAREGHGLPLFPQQGRAAARGARAQHRRLLPRADRAPRRRPRRWRSPTCSRSRTSTWSSRRCSCRSPRAASASWGRAFRPRRRSRSSSAWAERLQKAGAGLERHFAELQPGDGLALLRHSYALIIGLWQMSAGVAGAQHGLPDGGRARRRVAGVQLRLSRRARPRAARAVGRHRRPSRDRREARDERPADLAARRALHSPPPSPACGAEEPPADRSCARCSSRRSRSGRAIDSAVFAGEVKPRHEADLGFRIGGKIVARNVDVGARVKKGQPLARLDPADVGLQAEAAKAQVAATETEYQFAQAEYERYQNLFREKFISASALDAKKQRARREPRDASSRRRRTSPCRRTRRATRRSSRTRTASSPPRWGRAGTGGDGGAARGARRARGRARGRDQRAGEPHRRARRRAQRLVVALWAQAGPDLRGAACARSRRPSIRRRARSRCACRSSIPMPSVQWGMTANVALIAHGPPRRPRWCR